MTGETLRVAGTGPGVEGTTDDYHIHEDGVSLCGELYERLGDDRGEFATTWEYDVTDLDEIDRVTPFDVGLCEDCREIAEESGTERKFDGDTEQ